MVNLSNFSAILKELIEEENLNQKEYAGRMNFNIASITHYLKESRLPSVEAIVAIADYHHCSVDYLVGRETENFNLTFRKRPPFAERLKYLLSRFQCTPTKFCKTAKISKSRFYDWLNGKRQPSLDNIVKIAEGFDCRIDFVLGREA